VKLPKTFMPEKSLETKTEELLEEKEIKPKIDPKIPVLDEIMNEIEYNPNYHHSHKFHLNIFQEIVKKGYIIPGGIGHVTNNYFIKNDYSANTKNSQRTSILVQTFHKNKTKYYFASISNNEFCFFKEFVDLFEDYHPDSRVANFKASNFLFNKSMLASIVLTFTAYQITAALTSITQNFYGSVSSIALGGMLYGITGTILKKRKFKKNEENLRNLCEEFITDEKESIKKALE